MRITLSLAIICAATTVYAHQKWADGSDVAPWIRQACCGQAEAHLLDPMTVHVKSDGYHVDDYPWVIPFDHAEPSQDGNFWLFYPT